ncbi:MAG: beta-mannosidase [Bacteroidia bacterium]|jgi:beta-mannosidase
MRYLITVLICAISFLGFSQHGSVELSQNWQFRKVGDSEWLPTTVPGCVHTDLYDNGVIEDPLDADGEAKCKWIENESWEYQLNFRKQGLKLGKYQTLVFEGLDTYASVYLNDNLILVTENMFRRYETEISALLKDENELRVVFASSIKKGSEKRDELGFNLPSPSDTGDEKIASFVRKAGYQFGWDWGPRLVTSGIWKPVRIESWDEVRLENFRLRQDSLSEARMEGTAHFRIESSVETKIDLEVFIPGQTKKAKSANLKKGMNEVEVPFFIIDPKLWWPNGTGAQPIYAVTVTAKSSDKQLASLTRKIGVRSIKLINRADDIGTSFYFEINGKPIFMKGANMIPQSVFPSSVTEKETIDLLVAAKESNMNMLRVWGGGVYQSDRFYQVCDSLGILIWQDAMFACSIYPWDASFVENVKTEIRQQAERISDHACLAVWCGNNEVDVAWNNWGWQNEFKYDQAQQDSIWTGYKHLFDEVISQEIESVNPKSNYVSTSPLSNWGKEENFNHHNMHYWGVWHGTDNFDGFQKNVPRFMSEYGFQSFPMMKNISSESTKSLLESRQKSYKGNKEIDRHLNQHFPVYKSFEDYVYLSQLTQRLAMKTAIESHRLNRDKCMGTLYWQFNDVWLGPSWSTIDATGNWKAAHYTVVDLYKPIILLPESDDKNFKLSVVNDGLNSHQLSAKLKLIAFTGEIVWTADVPISARENSVTLVGEWLLKTMMKNPGLKRLSVLEIELFESDTLIDSELFYFGKPKELMLSNVGPKIEVELVGDHSILKITSPVLLKDVMLSTDVESKFSENYFDVLPGETKMVKVYTERVVIPKVKLKSLNQL